MTERPLTDAFPARSDLAAVAPWQVPADERLLELEEELTRRHQVYPGLVARGSLTSDDAALHLAVWRAMIADHRREAGLSAEPYRETWEARVRELRRELALRRNAYPKWIASPTNPLTATEATRRLDRLDALHWRYWMELAAFSPPGVRDRDNPRFAHHAAMRELARREAALDQAERAGGAGAALAARIRNHLIVAGRLAAATGSGRDWRTVVEGRDNLHRVWRSIDALIAERIGKDDPAIDAEVGQLWRLRQWLRALPDAIEDTPAAQPERLAA